jgi:eukaryotic-like serine/threonine-protein kinase
MKISTINRFFNILFGALAMLLVALVSAFIAMRLAIHGREVKVPDLTGLTLSDASKRASSVGLSLNLENSFYSANTPSGHILAQFPTPGTTVRRQWAVRITESLGAQQVATPDLLGQTERTATINVSLLLSAPQDSASPTAFVMPSLAGLTLASAAARTAAIGLHIVSAEDLNLPAQTTPATPKPTPTALPQTAPTTAATPIAPAATIGTVVAQSPPAGHRVVKGDPVHITLTN